MEDSYWGNLASVRWEEGIVEGTLFPRLSQQILIESNSREVLGTVDIPVNKTDKSP